MIFYRKIKYFKFKNGCIHWEELKKTEKDKIYDETVIHFYYFISSIWSMYQNNNRVCRLKYSIVTIAFDPRRTI